MKRYIIALLAIILICSCGKQSIGIDIEMHRQQVNDKLKENRHNIDTLLHWAECYNDSDDALATMLTYKAIGKLYREQSKFDSAIIFHKKSLSIAEELNDTIEIIQSNNEIATNFRRIGVQDEAASAHFDALVMCDAYSDKSSEFAIKNKVKTLNGIGNIYLSLGNDEMADSVFRLSLEGERKLGSPLGQAINLANIGSIFERKNEYDSARVYFQSSLLNNEIAKSVLGKGLCYIHLGNIDENQGDIESAIMHYKKAFSLMEKSADKWHWLEACISLARANIKIGDFQTTKNLLQRANDVATEIHSLDHLAIIHKLYYQLYKQSDPRKALEQYELSEAYTDSLNKSDEMNKLISIRVQYEQDKSSRKLLEINKTLTQEKHSKKVAIIITIILVVVFVAIFIILWSAYRIKRKGEKALLEMERIQKNFFTNITHEFRTPLTIILGLTEQIQKISTKESDKNIIEKVDIINKYGYNLLELVNQLLDISKVSSEFEEPEWHTGNIVAQIRMIIDNYKLYSRQKHVDLNFEASQSVIEADFVPSYITKIISNLISNAIKFTPKGGKISLSVKTDNEKIYISVSDTGIGISEEDKQHIFDLFYQVDNEHSTQGSGIGLPLVKQLVDKLEGTINVDSEPNKGTTFNIELKLRQGKTGLKRWIPDISDNDTEHYAEGSEQELEIDTSNIESGEINEEQKPTILIVDDNTDIAHYIADMLKDFYITITTDNGADGLTKAAEVVPDLIITDIMMPELNGYELCQRVRSSNVLNHIPIIVITAKSSAADRIKCYESGADAYIEKPFNTNELMIRVASLLSQRKNLREKYSISMYCDKDHAEGMTSGDSDFVNKVTDIIYAQLSNHDFNIEQLASRMCMSSSQLNRKIKSITGYSPATFAMQIRIEKAKRELTLSDAPIGDIADTCGFSDSSHFTRIFKQFTSMTPSQYRKTPKI